MLSTVVSQQEGPRFNSQVGSLNVLLVSVWVFTCQLWFLPQKLLFSWLILRLIFSPCPQPNALMKIWRSGHLMVAVHCSSEEEGSKTYKATIWTFFFWICLKRYNFHRSHKYDLILAPMLNSSFSKRLMCGKVAWICVNLCFDNSQGFDTHASQFAPSIADF